ncbi:MAG TPA: ABC transporter substrate-binding protein [Xanthobacteraceae bacterium]|nr:ABC transporter substrate-binding protein [Xanthobacteraceae bacterium]
MRRRDVIMLLGSAAAWPLAADAQQSAIPAIGFLHAASPDGNADRIRAFRQGLKDVGVVEGENVVVEYRWGDNQIDRLPALAADLVFRRVAVIAAVTNTAALAAKAATATTPIVFLASDDPVRMGLVSNLARPDGNLTGASFLAAELAAKRMELLRQVVPRITRIAAFVDPTNPTATESTLRDLEAAARAMRLQVDVHNAADIGQIEQTFTSFAHERPDALFVGSSPFFTDRRVQFALLAVLRKLPATYPWRDFAEVGGLMSYGASLRDAIRQVGIYTGRIIKGAKPADLPVLRSSKFEFVINLQAARAIELEVPNSIQLLADEVIE